MEVTKLCIFFLIVAASAASGPPASRMAAVGQLVARVDTNHDGTLTRDELTAEFDAHDPNGDGEVTETEYVHKFMQNNPGAPSLMARFIAKKLFKKLDKDSNHLVTRDEMWDPEVFGADGTISVVAMTNRIISLMLAQGGQNPAQQFQEQAMQRAVAVADRDGDGYITSDEFRAAASRHDANGDGHITRAEWVQGFQENNPAMGEMGAALAGITFDNIDKNPTDGVLTPEEMIPALPDIDKDGDGLVSVAEFKAHMLSTIHASQGQMAGHSPNDGHGHGQNTIN